MIDIFIFISRLNDFITIEYDPGYIYEFDIQINAKLVFKLMLSTASLRL